MFKIACRIIDPKLLGMFILIFPIGFLMVFLIGETFGGDLSGLGHLFQLIPILVLLSVAWKYPLVGGVLFFIIGLSLGILYAADANFQGTTVVLVETILFIPLVIAGLLFVVASRRNNF